MTKIVRKIALAAGLALAGCGSNASPEGALDGATVGHEDGGPGGERDSGTDARHAHDGYVDDARPGDSGADRMEVDAARGPVIDIPLTGCTAGTYLASVDIGGSQSFSLALDTGSTTLGVASSSCSSCGVSPLYAPGTGATDEHEQGNSEYGDGSDAGATGWVGEIYEDSVQVGQASGALVRMAFAAIQSQNQFFYSVACSGAVLPYDGILGFAPAKDALDGTDGYLDRLVAGGSIANVFATELCEPGGHLWLGGYDPAFVTGPPVYTPFSTSMYSQYSYVVDMERVTVGGTAVDLPLAEFGDTILDTGNSGFFLPPASFSVVASTIMASSGFAAAFGTDAGGADGGAPFFSGTFGASNCATTTLTKEELDSTLPPITLVFGSSPSISVTALSTESYLIPVGGGQWCPALYAITPDAAYPFVASLGAPVLRSSVVIFDRENRRIGFAPHTACP